MNEIQEPVFNKITKHRITHAPWECVHCGYVWYGINYHHRTTPENAVLCGSCWSALDNYLYRNHRQLYRIAHDDEIENGNAPILIVSKQWIEDKDNRPHPCPEKRKYSSSVPRWVRWAINAHQMKTNGKEVYVVYTSNRTLVKVSVFEESQQVN